MAMMVTRREILAEVETDCSWSVDETRDAIARRFPGTRDLDLVELLDAWAGDKKLKPDTLGHCLVLATAGIRILRKLVILAAGSLLIFGGHVAWVVTTYLFRVRFAESPEFPTALGQFWMTVPFILWIALAYWDKIKGYFAASRG